MIRTPGWLPVKEDDGVCTSQRSISVDPHVGLLPVFDLGILDPHDLGWCLIRMDNLAVVDQFMEPVIDQR